MPFYFFGIQNSELANCQTVHLLVSGNHDLDICDTKFQREPVIALALPATVKCLPART